MELAPGTVIAGKYQVGERIGEGAIGVVWRAVQLGLDRPVAVKFLHPQFVAREEARARFVREARVAASLDHPCSVAVLDFGEHAGLLYLVMELLVGESLRARLERGPIAIDEALEIMRQIASALAAAHRISLVHRDIKPENIFLEQTDGGPQVKVVDFGLAFIAAPDQESTQLGRMTEEGVLGGSPAYMSPEQVRGRGIGPPSDVYSLGCVLYELIAGRPPFVGSVGEVLTRHAYAPAQSLRELGLLTASQLAIDELVTAMLSKAAPARPTPNRIVAAIVALELPGDPRAGRTPSRTGDRRARTLSRPPLFDDEPGDDEVLKVVALGAIDDDLALLLAAAGLHLRAIRDDAAAEGMLVWAPGVELDRLALLAERGAVLVTDVATRDVSRLAGLVRAGVVEVIVQPVDGDELVRRIRRAHRHRAKVPVS